MFIRTVQHRTTVATIRSEVRSEGLVTTWREKKAVCSCDWQGELHEGAAAARRDARRHFKLATGRNFAALLREFLGLEPLGTYVMSSNATGEVVARLRTSAECTAWLNKNDRWVTSHSYRFVRKGA